MARDPPRRVHSKQVRSKKPDSPARSAVVQEDRLVRRKWAYTHNKYWWVSFCRAVEPARASRPARRPCRDADRPLSVRSATFRTGRWSLVCWGAPTGPARGPLCSSMQRSVGPTPPRGGCPLQGTSPGVTLHCRRGPAAVYRAGAPPGRPRASTPRGRSALTTSRWAWCSHCLGMGLQVGLGAGRRREGQGGVPTAVHVESDGGGRSATGGRTGPCALRR